MKTKLMERDSLQELEKVSCQSSVCVTDGTSTECQDSVWSGRDQSTPQRLLDKLSEQRSRDTQDSQLTLLCSTDAQESVCDSNQGDQTSTESLTSVCNAGEQQMLQTPVKIEVKQEEIKEEITAEEQQRDDDNEQVKMCSVKLLDCRNLMKMRRETTTEEQQRDDDDDDEQVKMCLVKLLDCRNLMKMRRETTTEEQQRDEDNDDVIPSEPPSAQSQLCKQWSRSVLCWTNYESLTSVCNAGEQQMLQTPVKIEVKQEEIKEEITAEEQQSDDDDDDDEQVKMCSVKLLDCRNLIKMRRETTTEEQQRDEDNDDVIPSEISQLKKEVTSLKAKLMERDDSLQELEKVSCQSSVCVTDGTSTECQDSVWSGRDQSTPQRLLDKLSEQRSRDTQDSQLTLLCSTDAQESVCDSNQGDQTSTESLTSVCNAGEQQMLQTPVKIEVMQEEIKEENTTEEQQSDEDDDEQQMLQTPVKIEVKQEEIKEENTTEEQQSDEDDDEQQMLQTPVKIEVKQEEIKEEITAEEQQRDDDDDDEQVKMCSVKLLDCRNLINMRRETTTEEQQRDEDDDVIPSESLTSVCKAGEQQMLQTPVKIEVKQEEIKIEEQQSDDDDFFPPELMKGRKERRELNKVEEKLQDQKHHDSRTGVKSLSVLKTKNNFSPKNHQRRSAKNPNTCTQCGKSFIHKSRFIMHMRVHAGDRNYTCHLCGKSFLYLKKHLKTHTYKIYKCSFCGKSYSHLYYFKQHQKIHTGVRSHLCFECGKIFTTATSLKQHQRIHTGQKPYKCSHCEKSFTWPQNLKTHERIHTGEKPYKCSLCGKSFTWLQNLKTHERIHTGEKPYKCSHCGKSFTQSGELKTHERIHTGEKPYQCSSCGRTFSGASNLRTHVKKYCPSSHSEQK
ncbi:zinc finger protein 37-like [Myxocyprinus asiaticus]|uniref:zinc finger protein 37-like n=1 Tax=Myxocyprinus asiaticus TaxID=70543 RepID=UPI002223B06F|nr:zinc finger protein 37-like [Myxocyprinus asiaticus]